MTPPSSPTSGPLHRIGSGGTTRPYQASGSTMDQYPDGPWGATWLLDGDGNAVKLKETGE